jgi:uncharacterized protein YxjI
MRYVMSSKWAFTERFSIADDAGTPVYEVYGNFGLTKQLSVCDPSGAEVARLGKHMMSSRYEITVGGQHAAEVSHRGVFGEHYSIDSARGTIDARGDFAGWNYTLSLSGQVLATVSRQLAFREKFLVETAPGQDDAFLLAAVLAIDNIHDDRRERSRRGMGMGMGMG